MPLTTLLIKTKKDSEKQVAFKINSMKGVEVMEEGESHLIAVTDTENSGDDLKIIQSIENINHTENVYVVMSINENSNMSKEFSL